MGKDLNGKELEPGFSQRENKTYHARYVDRFGKRHSLYNKSLKLLREELRKKQYEDANCLNIIDEGILLLDMFDKAVVNDFARKNPVRGIKLIRDEKIERRVLTCEEQATFFDCCKGTFYDNLFVVAVTTGLRPGELYALTWNDIDLEKNEINVTKTLLYQKLEGDKQKTFHVHPPKTESSERKVPINKQCFLALKKQKMLKNAVSGKHNKFLKGFEDLLFVTKYNTPINAEIYGSAIRKIVDEINLSCDALESFAYFSAHTFQHTFVTRCLEANMNLKTVQALLGHAASEMTTNLYMHVLKEHKDNEMKKYEQNFDLIAASSDFYTETKFDRFVKNECNKNKIINLELGK